jgi:hypothetical protein
MTCISIKYDLVWQLNSCSNYRFTANGICINVNTNRIIKKTVVGYTAGYNINGRFRSVKRLRGELVKINRLEELPF